MVYSCWIEHLVDRCVLFRLRSSRLFQRKDFAGLPFESLLKNIVSEKTLATALKFVTVLWSERTKENLVKTINPLGEVEVNFDSGSGKTSTRYLQFEFHRVRVDGKIPARAGGGLGCERASGSRPRTAVLAKSGAGDKSIPCWAYCTSIRRNSPHS